MEFLAEIGSRTYFNFYSFASILAVVLCLFLAVFLLSLKNKSKSTTHFGIMFLTAAPFYLAYALTAFYYHPDGALHRWLTVGLIFPLEIHMTQWLFKFPTNSHPRLSRLIMVIQYALALTVTGIFINVTWDANRVFLFSAHYWDFDAEDISRTVAYLIQAYLAVILVTGIWKAVVTKSGERWAIIQIVIALLISTIVPSRTNVLSRDGALDRGTHQTLMVLLLLLAFFVMFIIYLNSTKDRTSFMAKIVGISLVTFLITLQFLGFFQTRAGEEQYDALRREHVYRALEGGDRDRDIEYILRYDLAAGRMDRVFMVDGVNIDFDDHTEELKNSAVYAALAALPPESFRDRYAGLFGNSEYFRGYRESVVAFVDDYPADDELKAATFEYIEALNTDALVNFNKLNVLSNDDFRGAALKHLQKPGERFVHFASALQKSIEQSPLQGAELKEEVLKYLSPFRAPMVRTYRKNMDETRDNYRHFIAYVYQDRTRTAMYEVGFAYTAYRAFMHPAALIQTLILCAVLFVVLGLFPLFFRGSLLLPLRSLLDGVRKVNDGDLSVKVPVKVEDEIGFITDSFNNMVTSIRDARAQLEDYAHNLEEKVKDRTAELNKTLEQVQALKVQQDGDYFLTSLLARPLFYNANKSRTVTTEFILMQKKNFEFRNKKSDLGGDICVTGMLRLGQPDNFRRYIVAVNGDAMGKSMQGAGGALVMGVVMNSIMARSAKNNRILDTTPEAWLAEVYEELHGVFLAFNGSMVISAVISVIDEETGEMWYINAEHPYTVLYRNGRATFVEEEMMLRKIGLESEIPFSVRKFQLEPGDLLIMGSDGRDDIDITPGAEVRTINEDETLFLRRVEESRGDLNGIVERLKAFGTLTDDLSLLRIGFQEDPALRRESLLEPQKTIIDIDLQPELIDQDAEQTFERLFQRGRQLVREGKSGEALEYLKEAYNLRRDVPALNKTMAVLTFKEKDYRQAVEILDKYLQHDPGIVDFWLYLSIAHKRNGNYNKALEAAQRVFEMNPDRVPNLVQLADLYQKLGHMGRARIFLEKALELDPTNEQAQSLQASMAG
ncbi:MAG: SpoIIE family protein phosphatase [Spirochaetales bacterium]|nr:SpoIIE family protein phosphatase [Spirochaetales bacterium]